MSTLGNAITIGENNSIFIECLTIEQSSLIVRPRTKVIWLGRKHTTLIAPSRVSAYECATVNLE